MVLTWLIIAATLLTSSTASGEIIKVGYLAARKGTSGMLGLSISGAMTYAVETINKRTDLLPGHELQFAFADTEGDTRVGTRHLTEMICNGTVAFFGPEESCFVEANVAAAFNLPMISYKCADDAVSNKKDFPNFARTYPRVMQVIKSVIALLHYYNWHKFSILVEDTPEQRKIADTLQQVALEENMVVNRMKVFPNRARCCSESLKCCDFKISNIIQETKDNTRIYVFLGSTEELNDMMFSMSLFKLLDGSYMVIYVYVDFAYSALNSYKYMWSLSKMWELVDKSDYQCQPTDTNPVRSLLVVQPSTRERNAGNFADNVRKYNKLPPFNLTQIIGWDYKKPVGVFAAHLYDSVMMYATALNATLADNPGVPLQRLLTNGSAIISRIRNRTFQSVMGSEIKMNDNGDSEGNFSVLSLQPGCNYSFVRANRSTTLFCDECMQPIGQFHLIGEKLPEFRLDPGKTVNWMGGSRPSDEPPCGFDGTKCFRPEGDRRKIVAGVLGSLIVLALLVMLSVYRVWKEEQEIVGLLWRIAPEALEDAASPRLGESPSRLSLASNASFESKGFGQIFTPTGRYRGIIVRIQDLHFNKKIDISRAMMKEMRTMRELQHPNVNSFLGAVVEPACVRVVTDYCTRGSLPDILEGGELNLEYMFIAELIRDLIKGMLYLHSSTLVVHGNLKSSNCVVTSRWVLKVTDCGLHELRQQADKGSVCDYQHYKGQLWRSPELLRSPLVAPRGTQPGDVYAFGIILHEILGREGPFGSTCSPREEPKQIVERVEAGPGAEELPFRPPINSLRPPPDMPPALVKLVTECMQQCWSESSESRPTFFEIKKQLQPLREGLSTNLVNQMMEKMEKYANNLEDLVRERTQLLNEEKQKTEALLYRMLPPPVAYNLTRGIPVQPETFDSVTIYFSDIVGFTQISADSSPLQVVELLNDLYTLFDDVIRGYDVYKVETIGDAYMVVSGVPDRNGFRHAGEIASMALSLLAAIEKHTIQHCPEQKLKLRIGVHTGQVVAGVVGLTMPRYCLFGDTVNTASRIESTGEPLRIHISDCCQRTLSRLGGYRTERRGAVPMKGKGLVETHWLTGADASAVQRRPTELSTLPPLFSRAGGTGGKGVRGSASTLQLKCEDSVHRGSTRSMIARGSAPVRSAADSPRISRTHPPSPVLQSDARPPPQSPERSPLSEPVLGRLPVPLFLQRRLPGPAAGSLPAIRECRSLDNFGEALLPAARTAPRRRDSRSVGNCRDLQQESLHSLVAEQRRRSPAEGDVSARLLRQRLAEEVAREQAEEAEPGEGPAASDGDAAVVGLSGSPPVWDLVKDWCRRFFTQHRLEPAMPLNGKLKHNGYSLHSSNDTVV